MILPYRVRRHLVYSAFPVLCCQAREICAAYGLSSHGCAAIATDKCARLGQNSSSVRADLTWMDDQSVHPAVLPPVEPVSVSINMPLSGEVLHYNLSTMTGTFAACAAGGLGGGSCYALLNAVQGALENHDTRQRLTTLERRYGTIGRLAAQYDNSSAAHQRQQTDLEMLLR